jgi:hypothetical protein
MAGLQGVADEPAGGEGGGVQLGRGLGDRELQHQRGAPAAELDAALGARPGPQPVSARGVDVVQVGEVRGQDEDVALGALPGVPQVVEREQGVYRVQFLDLLDQHESTLGGTTDISRRPSAVVVAVRGVV